MGEPARAPQTEADARRDARQTLRAVMERAVEMQAEPPPKAPSRVVPAVAIILALASVYLWFGNPSWLRDPDLTPPPEYQDASVRWAVYVTSQRVEQYRIQHGKLPSSLMETGSTPDGIEYQRSADDHYQITGRNGTILISFSSGDDVKRLLGDHLDRLGFGRRASS